jgi:hypothetical protein
MFSAPSTIRSLAGNNDRVNHGAEHSIGRVCRSPMNELLSLPIDCHWRPPRPEVTDLLRFNKLYGREQKVVQASDFFLFTIKE